MIFWYKIFLGIFLEISQSGIRALEIRNILIKIPLRRAYIQLGGKMVRQSPNDSEEPTIYREVIQSKG